MQVHLETIKTLPADVYKTKRGPVTIERKTVEVTVGKDRRAIACYESADRIDLYGLAVRFSQGSKVWPASAVYWRASGNVNNLRPNIDKRGHFTLVGFAEDFDGKPVRSQHNAVA